MAKPKPLDAYKDLLFNGASVEHVAEVSGASLEEVRAYAKGLNLPGDAKPQAAEPVPDEPTNDVNTDALHEPIVSNTNDDLVSLIGVLTKRLDKAEAEIKVLTSEVKSTRANCESEISRVRLDMLSSVEVLKNSAKASGAVTSERGPCPTVVKVVCDTVVIQGERGGVHPFKRGDVVSVGINGEYVVAALWARGAKVCVQYGS